MTLLGIVTVASGFDDTLPLGGLAPLLRHALAFQAAGAETVVFVGEQVALPADARLTVPVSSLKSSAELPAHGSALVIRADVTTHRALPARLAKLIDEGGEPVIAGDDSAAIVGTGGTHTREVVDALGQGALPKLGRRAELEGQGAFAEFVVRAGTPAERRRATEKHLHSLRKPTGGMFENFYMRPLSKPMTRILCRTPITPNAMSVVTLGVALLAAALVAMPDPLWSVAGGLLHMWMRVVDCVDGELARLRYQSSRFGEWLDTVGDGIGMAAFILGVTVTAMRADPSMLTVGLVGVVAWTLVQTLQITAAMISGRTGTFHRIEWGHRAQRQNLVERVVSRLELLLRIDAISTYYGIAVALGAHRALLWAHATVAVVAVVYFGAQVLKLRAQARAA